MTATILTHIVHVLIVFVLRVGNHRVDPRSFVFRVGDHFRTPWPLEIRVIHHRGLPLAIIFVIPVIGFGRIRIGKLHRLVIISLRLFVLRIDNLLLIHPILRLRLVGILDLLLGEEVELVLKLARSDGLVVHKDLEGVVRTEDEGVEVRELIVLASNILLDEEVVVLLVRVEDDVRALVRGAANVGTEHDTVRGVAAKFGSLEFIPPRKKFDVGSAAIELLLVLDRVLDDEVFLFRAVEGLAQGSGKAVESSVLRGFDALVVCATMPFSSGVFPFAKFGLALPVGGDCPSVSPAIIIELLLEINFSRS
mmetsp:Transcript_5175/g.9154  ORF Transcript_5175/g.9154 Transcript_5175/m.9154 type:complete len:308 (-) Transcript_5175:75-998(-)